MKNVSKKSIIILRLRFIFAFLLIYFVLGFTFLSYSVLELTIYIILFVVLFLLLKFYCPLVYRKTKYKIVASNIFLEKGVLFLKYQFADLRLVQYTEFKKTPLQRLFKVGTIFLHFHGTKITIKYITTPSYKEIEDEIQKKMGLYFAMSE